MTDVASDPKPLLALPTVRGIGELIHCIFSAFGQPVHLPREGEPSPDAMEREIGEVAACLVCCDHPSAVFDELRRRAVEASLPLVLFSSRKRAEDVSRVARELSLPWVDLTDDPRAIVGSVRRVLEQAGDEQHP